ncbi:MAG: hypothetical protein E7663_01715 [Ruminococcaceae bacterium]|nr:hypothetical protein [Oscillospiraceae bacterium]
MNRKHQNVTAVESGEYAVHRNRRNDIIAAVVCLFLAFLVWLFVMNTEDTAFVALEITDPASGYTFVLSDSMIEVKGSVLSLKRADRVEIVLPPEAVTEGTYRIELEDLVLPAGTTPAGALELIVTVEKSGS